MNGYRSAWLLLTALFAVTSGNVAGAKDLFVSPSGSDSNSGTAQTAPLKTIAAASGKAYAGDTIYLMPGRYLEAIVPVRSGAAGNPITYKSLGPSRAVLTHGSVSGLKSAIAITNLSDITIDGVDVDGVAVRPNARVDHFASLNGARRIVIKKGVFLYANGWSGFDLESSAYVTIEDNTIEWVGAYDDPSASVYDVGDGISARYGSPHHVLIQRNVMRHGGHDLYRIEGQYNIVQDNHFDNSYRDVLGGNKGQRAGDVIGANNIFQRNFVTGAGASADAPSNMLQKIQGVGAIVRQNVFYSTIQEGIMSAARDKVPVSKNMRIYNNTFVDLGGPAWTMWYYQTGVEIGNGVFIDNIVLDSRRAPISSSDDSDIRFEVSGAANGPTAGSRIEGNLIGPAQGKVPMVKLGGFDGRIEIAVAEARYPDLFVDNIAGRAVFASNERNSIADFKLAAGSPGIDQGSFLTAVVGSGSSNTLKVLDAQYFSDGFGLIAGDDIQLEGTGKRVRVSGVDYVAKALQLAESVTFSDGQGVALAYAGRSPDIGAAEYQLVDGSAAPASPEALVVK